MTNSASTISPRRRKQPADALSPSPAAPVSMPQGDASPRVLIRLPAITAIGPLATPATSKQADSAKQTTLFSLGAKSTFATTSATTAASPAAAGASPPSAAWSSMPWYARLNTPRMQKYLPYATALAIVTCMFIWMRTHSGKSKSGAARFEEPAWNTRSASPDRQVVGPAANASGATPNWNGPAWTAPKGTAPAVAPNGSGGAPSASQAPPAPTSVSAGADPPTAGPVIPDSFQSGATPAGWQGGAAANNPTAGPVAPPHDAVPPMPARNPALNIPPGGDPGVVQGGPIGPELRTAAANDPATIPPGHGDANPNAIPGGAQFQGTAPPQR